MGRLHHLTTIRGHWSSSGFIAEWISNVPDGSSNREAKILSETDEFLYIVTHDLKAFARALRLIPDWIREDLKDQKFELPKEAAENFEMLCDYAQRLDGMLDALTELSRVGRTADPAASHNLKTLLISCWQHIAAPPDLELVVETDESDVFGPRNDLVRLFCALFENAVRHNTGAVTTVRVEVGKRLERLHFAIEDDGTGIPLDLREKLLKPLQTLRAKGDGGSAGVGLSIARKVVENAGGQLTLVDPRGPQGCRVEFDLPLSAARN